MGIHCATFRCRDFDPGKFLFCLSTSIQTSDYKSFHNGFFCLKSENMARVDSFMTLKDYQEHEKEAKGKGESRQFMKVFWTRSHLGDLNKTLKEVPETGKVSSQKERDSLDGTDRVSASKG